MKLLTYRFRDDFPVVLLPTARRALREAADAWKESRVVRLVEIMGAAGSADILITHEHMAASHMEDGGMRHAPMAYDAASARIIVNAHYTWATSAWQFWRLRLTAADFAHELGHAMGLPHTKHDFSCMRQGSGMLPLWYDLQTLRAAIARDRNTIA